MEHPDKSPRRYFRLHYIVLRIIGIGMFHHPDENNFDNYPNRSYFAFAVFTAVFLVWYIVSEFYNVHVMWSTGRNAQEMFLGISSIGIHFFTAIKTYFLIKYNKKIQKIIRVIEIDSKQFKYDEKITKETIFYSKVLTYFFLSMGNSTILAMALNVVYRDFQHQKELRMSNDTVAVPRMVPFDGYIPWDHQDDRNYIYASVYNSTATIWLGTLIMIEDTLIASIMAHLSGQYKTVQTFIEDVGERTIEILLNRLDRNKLEQLNTFIEYDEKNYAKMASDKESVERHRLDKFLLKRKRILLYYDEVEFNNVMIDCIKEAIQYHQLIIEITSELQEVYTIGFLCQILSSFYSIAIVLVQVALSGNELISLTFATNMGYLGSIMWQLFMQTYSANEVTLQASKVGDSAFKSCWFAVSHDNGERRRLLQLIVHRSQKKIYLTAGKFSPMTNVLFVAVMRRSYQIFTLIATAMSGKRRY